MNLEWHKKHKMPSAATVKERVEWHLEHTRNCSCRPFPKGLLSELSEKQISAISQPRQGQGSGNRE